MSSVRDGAARVIGACCLAIIAALFVIGLAAQEIVRHVIQGLPFWIGAILGVRRSGLAKWAALPLMLFWLLVSVLIWLYLLRLSTIVRGHYSPTEIAMTVVIALSAVVAIAATIRVKSKVAGWAAALVFLVTAGFHFGVFAVSLQPQVAHDSVVIEAFRTHVNPR